MIIEIPKQRNVTILPQFAIVDKSSHHTARINVSRNAFLNLRSEEKTFSLTFIPGKNKSKCGFVVCTLIDNGYASLLFSQTMFSYCFCMLSEFAKVFERKADVYCIMQGVHFQVGVGDFNCRQILTKISFVIFHIVVYLKQIERG